MRPLALLLLPALLLPALPASAQTPPLTTFAEGIGQDPSTLLRTAEARLHAGRLANAAELVERAETLMLTRAELANRADSPARSDIIGATNAARAALRVNDSTTAAAQITRARTLLAQLGVDSVAGDKLDAPSAPAVAINPASPAATVQPWSPMAVTKPAP